jgi:replicative DNA helicase
MENSERIPPYSEEAERALLGCILFDFDRGFEAMRKFELTAEAFYVPAHRLVAEHVASMEKASKTVNLITATETLRLAGVLDRVGGVDAIHRMVDAVVSPTYAHSYAETVRKRWAQREIMQKAMAVYAEAQDTDDPDGLTAKAETEFSKIGQIQQPESLHGVWRSICKDMAAGMKGEQVNIALPTGFDHVDRVLTGGLRPGGVYYVTGKKGCGKTTWKCSVINQQLFRGKRVSDASLEMTMRQEIEKLAGAQMNVNVSDVIMGKSAVTLEKVARVEQIIANGMLRIETRIETTSQLRAWIRREVEKYKADLICVDYIQLVRSSDVKGAEIFEQVTEASRAITRAAREFNVPILCVSMMSEQGLWGSRQLDYDAYATLEMRTESVPEPPDFIKDVQCFFNKNRFGPEHFGIDFKLYGRVGRMEEVNAASAKGWDNEEA